MGTRGRVALQQAQQLHGQPRRRHKVVGVVLEVDGGRRHDLGITQQTHKIVKSELHNKHTTTHREIRVTQKTHNHAQLKSVIHKTHNYLHNKLPGCILLPCGGAYPAEAGDGQGHGGLEVVWTLLGQSGDEAGG